MLVQRLYFGLRHSVFFFDCVDYDSLLYFSMVCVFSSWTLEFFKIISINSAIYWEEDACSKTSLSWSELSSFSVHSFNLLFLLDLTDVFEVSLRSFEVYLRSFEVILRSCWLYSIGWMHIYFSSISLKGGGRYCQFFIYFRSLFLD